LEPQREIYEWICRFSRISAGVLTLRSLRVPITSGGRESGPEAGGDTVARPRSSPPEMRTAGALFHVMDVAPDVLVIVMMSDPVEPHLIVAAWTGDTVAVDDPADALVKRRAAFRAAHADFQVIDRIVHRLVLRFRPCHGVVDGA
jgi:hypothetical protein